MTETYYLRHVPQSEYRRLQERKEEKEKSYLLDLDLKNLGLKDKEVMAHLTEIIFNEGKKIVESSLPEEMWEEVIKGPCFKKICKKLGLK
ncbi:hypothetical protein ACFLZV_02690 [Candidatus Margulisiibacteriota bacterium]